MSPLNTDLSRKTDLPNDRSPAPNNNNGATIYNYIDLGDVFHYESIVQMSENKILACYSLANILFDKKALRWLRHVLIMFTLVATVTFVYI